MTPEPDKGTIMISIVNGTRQPLPGKPDILIRVLDGRKRAIVSPWVNGSPVYIRNVRCRGNSDDLYTIFAHARGYEDGAIYPVRVLKGKLVNAAIMLLPKNGRFVFQPLASWWTDESLHQLVANGASEPATRFSETFEAKNLEVGALLTIGAAVKNILLDDQTRALNYFWQVRWEHLRADRFWAWVEVGLAERIQKLAALNLFAEEPDAAHWHPAVSGVCEAATRSWKQTRFDVSNVQLTFHENDRQDLVKPDGTPVHCVLVEPDIDYYKDVVAHGFLEVLPNLATGRKTDPRIVYQLRWMATKQEGLTEFAPPCTVQ